MLNKACIIGNLGQNPEVKRFPDGTAFVNLSLATSESWKDKTSGEKREETEWHRVVVRGRQAEVVGEYCRKGSTIYVEGKLKTRKWTDKDGVEKTSTEIHVSELKLISRGKNSEEGGGSTASQQESGASNDFDSVPF